MKHHRSGEPRSLYCLIDLIAFIGVIINAILNNKHWQPEKLRNFILILCKISNQWNSPWAIRVVESNEAINLNDNHMSIYDNGNVYTMNPSGACSIDLKLYWENVHLMQSLKQAASGAIGVCVAGANLER